MIQSYNDLNVYKRSYDIALKLYKFARTLPEDERFGLTSQIKRAATSIPLNIAEGYGKKSSEQEFKRFLIMAQGSCNEMMVLLRFSYDLGFMNKESHEIFASEYDEIVRMINSMISKWQTFKKSNI